MNPTGAGTGTSTHRRAHWTRPRRDGGPDPWPAEIELSFEAARDGAYPVIMRVDGHGPRAVGSFRPPFTDAAAREALGWQRYGPDQQQAQEVGARLFHELFDGALGELYQAARRSRTVSPRVRIVARDPALARIPWELLYDPDQASFVVDRHPIIRNLPGSNPAAPDPAPGPPQLLIADAAPRGGSGQRRVLDAAGLGAALAGLAGQGRLQVTTMAHTTLPALRARLLAASATDDAPPFQMLHLSCPTRIDEVTGQATLLLEGDDGEPDPITDQDLAAALRSSGIQLVLLDVRQPSAAGHLTAHAYAPALLRVGIPAVVGAPIATRENAPDLVRALYGALADGQPVQEALAQASWPTADPGSGRATAELPVCYQSTTSGRLFTPPRPARWSRQQGWRTTRRWIALTVAVLGFIGTVNGLYDAYERRVKGQPPIRMTGHVNVAVAEFGVAGPDEDRTHLAIAKDLARETANQLRRQLRPAADQDLRIDVHGPEQLAPGPIRGASQLERQQHAEELGRQVNAHVVVYGELRAGPLGTSLRPEFALSSDLVLRGAEELIDAQAGEHRLGAAIERPGDVAINQLVYGDLHKELAARVKVLADVAAGLVFLNNSDRAAEAAPFFRAAEAVKGWGDQEGKEVLYLLLGNAKLRWFSQTVQAARTRPSVARRMLDDAAGHYRHALGIDPRYARAKLGLAETIFLRAQGSCRPRRADRSGLEQAAKLFATAGRSANQPHTADIATKVAFGLGRTYVCLTSVGIDHQSQARQQLGAVLRDYNPAPGNYNPRVKLLAAEAHGQLGALDYVLATTTQSHQQYQRAATSYEQAVELSAGRPDRQWKFHDVLAAVYRRLGDTTRAEQAARNADAARQAADLPPLDRP